MLPSCRPPKWLRLKGCSVSQHCTGQNWKDYKVHLIWSSVGFQDDPVVSLGDKSLAEFFGGDSFGSRTSEVEEEVQTLARLCKNKASVGFLLMKWSLIHVGEPHDLNEINSEKIGWFKLINLVDVYVESGEKRKERAQSGGSGWKNQNHSSLQRSYSILTDWWAHCCHGNGWHPLGWRLLPQDAVDCTIFYIHTL